MYHQVSSCPVPAFARYTVTTQTFAKQMRWLALAGYHTITLDTFIKYRIHGQKLPKRTVIITFDDGFKECVEFATSILCKYRFTATFYLVAGIMDQQSTWLQAECGITFPIVDWATAREIERQGFVCGAHTTTHQRLANLDVETCHSELFESRRLLEEHLGHTVHHMAYPFGSYDQRTREIAVDVGFLSACSTRKGFSSLNDDLLALHRVSIYGHDTLLDFACRLLTARSMRELIRDGVRRVRQSSWTTEKGDA